MNPNKKRKLSGSITEGIDLTARIVTVTAEDATKSFTVHEDLLRSESDFFKAALSSSWEEGKQGQISLPEDPVEVVEHYLQYLYSDKIRIVWSKPSEALKKQDTLPEYITLALLYVFGEKIGDVKFKNAVVRLMLQRMNTPIGGAFFLPIGESVDIIYKGTIAGSKMRKLLADVTAEYGSPQCILSSVDDNNAEFLCDLLRVCLNRSRGALAEISKLMQDKVYEEAVRKEGTSK